MGHVGPINRKSCVLKIFLMHIHNVLKVAVKNCSKTSRFKMDEALDCLKTFSFN